MKTIKQLEEEIQEQSERIVAIGQLADEEKRGLTDEDAAEIDRIESVVGVKASKDGSTKATGLEKELAYARKLETKQAEIAASRSVQRFNETDDDTDDLNDVGTAARFKIPARARRNVKYFDSPESAYTAGKFLQAVLAHNEDAKRWCNDHSVDIRAASQVESDNSLGGVFVPTEMENAMISLQEAYGVYRREVGVTPMTSDKKTVPKELTGVTIYFPGETDDVTVSNMTFGDVELNAIVMAGMSKISSDLNEDSLISMAETLTRSFSRKLAEKEDDCGFNGDGTSTYGGITGIIPKLASAGIQDAASGNVSFATFDLDDFTNTEAKITHYEGLMPKWYIHPSGWAKSMKRLALAQGGSTGMEVVNGVPMFEFGGYPVVPTNALPSTDTVSTVQVLFGDLTMNSRMGVRRGITVATDSSLFFASRQLAVRVDQRIAINNHETSGTCVGLKTAAS